MSLPHQTSLTSLWNTLEEKGSSVSVDLRAAQEKTNGLLRRCPAPSPPSCGALCGGFLPLATTGTIPRTGFQVSPRGFLVSSR